MERALPIEELAKQRLNLMVQTYSLFTKNLMEEGLDREKVKKASDKVWRILGGQAGEQMKAMLGGAEKIAAAQQAGVIIKSLHDLETKVETKENELRTEFLKCPWQETAESLELPKEWRFCSSGHAAFMEKMLNIMNPDTSFQLTKSMPMGDKVCESVEAF